MATPDGKAQGGKEIELVEQPRPGGGSDPSASFWARVQSAARFAITGKAPDGWFGPAKPMGPSAPVEEKGRQFDYPFAVNLSYTPRGETGENEINFTTLRRMADPLLGGLDLMRLAIETRKDQMAGQQWTIKLRDEQGDGGEKARAIRAALRRPDGVTPFRLWQRQLLEDLLVIDAPAIYINRTRGKPNLPASIQDEPEEAPFNSAAPPIRSEGGEGGLPGGMEGGAEGQGDEEGGLDAQGRPALPAHADGGPADGQEGLEGQEDDGRPFPGDEQQAEAQDGEQAPEEGRDDRTDGGLPVGQDDQEQPLGVGADREATEPGSPDQGSPEDPEARKKKPGFLQRIDYRDGDLRKVAKAGFPFGDKKRPLADDGKDAAPAGDRGAQGSQGAGAPPPGPEDRQGSAPGATPAIGDRPPFPPEDGEEGKDGEAGPKDDALARPAPFGAVKPKLGPDGKPLPPQAGDLGPDGKPVKIGLDGKPIPPPKKIVIANHTADEVGVLLEAVDGATLKRLLRSDGRTPRPPEPAYLQALKGLPAFHYTTDEIIYAPRNLRTNRIYGQSPVEQVLTTVDIALRRQLSQKEYYTAGSIPDMMLGVPETWTPAQIAEFQAYWDTVMSGDTAARRRAHFVPGGMNAIPTKDPKVKDEWDEWLARIICYAFSLSPQALVQQMNRATAETAEEQALSEGLEPLKLWFKDTMDTVLAVGFDAPEMEFAYEDEEISDPKVKLEVWAGLVGAGIATKNEARDAYGWDPIEGLDDPPPPPMDPFGGPPGPPGAPPGPGQPPGPGGPPSPFGGKPGGKPPFGKPTGAPPFGAKGGSPFGGKPNPFAAKPGGPPPLPGKKPNPFAAKADGYEIVDGEYTVLKGDAPGHPFRGNQYSEGMTSDGKPWDGAKESRQADNASTPEDHRIAAAYHARTAREMLEESRRTWEVNGDAREAEDFRQGSNDHRVAAADHEAAAKNPRHGAAARRASRQAHGTTEKGDSPGHPFRGNQYGEGEGEDYVEPEDREGYDPEDGRDHLSPEERDAVVRTNREYEAQQRGPGETKYGKYDVQPGEGGVAVIFTPKDGRPQMHGPFKSEDEARSYANQHHTEHARQEPERERERQKTAARSARTAAQHGAASDFHRKQADEASKKGDSQLALHHLRTSAAHAEAAVALSSRDKGARDKSMAARNASRARAYYKGERPGGLLKGGQGASGPRKRPGLPVRRVVRPEAAITARLNAYFREYLALVLASLGLKKADGVKLSADDLKTLQSVVTEEDLQTLIVALKGDLGRVVQAAAAEALKQLRQQGVLSVGVSLAQVNQRAAEWASTHAGTLITNITATMRDGVQRMVEAAIEDEASVEQLREALYANPLFHGPRAEMIARTELAFANVAGNTIAWEDSGVVEAVRWVVGAGCCEKCQQLDGIEIPLGESFWWDGEEIDGPPAHPNCRCDILPVVISAADARAMGADDEETEKGDFAGHPFRGNQWTHEADGTPMGEERISDLNRADRVSHDLTAIETHERGEAPSPRQMVNRYRKLAAKYEISLDDDPPADNAYEEAHRLHTVIGDYIENLQTRSIGKGDSDGHPFRGNQYTQGKGGSAPMRDASGDAGFLFQGKDAVAYVAAESDMDVGGQRYAVICRHNNIGGSKSKADAKLLARYPDNFCEACASMGKGDFTGHPFRGNQFTDGTGGGAAGGASLPDNKVRPHERPRADRERMAAALAAMPEEERDDIDTYDFGHDAFVLYEARKKMPKKEGTIRSVTDNTSDYLWEECHGVANVDGKPHLAIKEEDPDNAEDVDEESAGKVWAFQDPADGPSAPRFEANTFDKEEAVQQYKAHLAAKKLKKGDLPGHEFRGNQYTGGGGGGRTPEFREWFAESRVVDAKGEPLRVYRGTPEDEGSDLSRSRANEEGRIWFTDDPDNASAYSGSGWEDQANAPNVVPAHLSMQNPYEITVPEYTSWDAIPTPPEMKAAGWGRATVTTNEVADFASSDHDGVIIHNVTDPGGFEDAMPGTSYCVFDASQVKSIFNRRPTNEPDITKGDLPGHEFRGNQYTDSAGDAGDDDEDYWGDRVGVERPPQSRTQVKVNWGAQDLADTADHGSVNEESILRDYGTKGWPTEVHRAWIDINDLHEMLGDEPADGAWQEDYSMRNTFPPAKVRVLPHGQLSLIDGNHRTTYWRQMGVTHVPAWVLDERPNRVGARIKKGDVDGHPFRGNQWTDGQGAGGEAPKDDRPAAKDEPREPKAAADRDNADWASRAQDAIAQDNLGLVKDEFDKLPQEARDRLADPAKTVPERVKELLGDTPRPNTGDGAVDAAARVEQYAGQMHADATRKAQDVVIGLHSDLVAAGCDPKLANKMAMDAAEHLVAQELEGQGRTLGDHGIHHLEGNARMATDVLKVIPGGHDTPENRSLMRLAAVYHDTGYLTPPSGAFLDKDHPRWSAQYMEAKILGDVQSAFGKEKADELRTIVAEHAWEGADWDAKPVHSAFAVADNMALFEREKMPPLMRSVPKAQGILVDFARKKITREECVKQIRTEIATRNDLAPAVRDRFHKAAGEITSFLPKATIGMINAELQGMSWDGALRVDVRRGKSNEALGKVIDFGQNQFNKMAKTYKADGKALVEKGETVFSTKGGRPLIRMVLHDSKHKVWSLDGPALADAIRKGRLGPLRKGDADGHPFRGNQFTQGGGAAADDDEDGPYYREDGQFGENTDSYRALVEAHANALPPAARRVIDHYAEGVSGTPGSASNTGKMEAAIAAHGIVLSDKTVLYRGLSFTGPEERRAFLAGASSGATLRSVGDPQSTSMNSKVAQDFAGLHGHNDIIIAIEGLGGVRALPIPSSGQSELVLSKDVALRVTTSVKRKDGSVLIYASVAR